MLGLARHLATGEAADPAAIAAWSAGEEARAFMRRSGEGWYDADVASGADPAEARPRADRTLAAYLGEEEPG